MRDICERSLSIIPENFSLKKYNTCFNSGMCFPSNEYKLKNQFLGETLADMYSIKKQTPKDRTAQDMNHELKDTGVHALSIWPGAVKTELIRENILDKEATNDKEREAQQMFSTGQTTDWVGRTVAQLLLIDVKPLAGRVVVW